LATLHTARLTLRRWQPEDHEPFIAMNLDPEVMRYFPSTYTREQSLEHISRMNALIDAEGWGFWSASTRQGHDFIGVIGLIARDHTSPLPHAPCVEVGWRVAQKHWRRGYATEAALASLQYAFEHLHKAEIVAFTAIQNTPSRKVMEKLGMHNLQEDFDHPNVPDHSHVKRHCVYKLTREEWLNAHPSPSYTVDIS